MQRGRDGGRLLCDLAVGEAQGAPAGGGVDRVAAAVVLERRPRLVVLPAVGLDEDAVRFEDEVRFDALHVVVDPRLRKAGVAAELEEALLEHGLREDGAGLVVVEGVQELVGSAMAGAGSCQGNEGGDVREPRQLRAVEQALDAAAVEPRSEIEDGPRRRGDHDAVLGGRLGVEASGTMLPDPALVAAAARTGHGHVDDRDVTGAKLPQRARRGVT